MRENKIFTIIIVIAILYLILKILHRIFPSKMNHRKQFKITSQKNKKKPED